MSATEPLTPPSPEEIDLDPPGPAGTAGPCPSCAATAAGETVACLDEAACSCALHQHGAWS